jgi:tetrapyrrole methylase family protein / MazG family protein
MAEISIVGVGIRGARHMTLETVDAIRAADVVFYLVTGAEAVAEIRRLNRNTHGLFHMYREGALDLDVYGQIVSFLLAQGIAAPRVVFAVMGHPSIYVAATHLLREHGPRWGVRINVLAGVSAIDVLLLSMPDIGSSGLQILDANRLVSYRLTPDNRVPAMIFQIGCFGSGFITHGQENRPDRLALAELARAGHLVNYNSTLFVPPARPFEVLDGQFQAQLVDPRAIGERVAS